MNGWDGEAPALEKLLSYAIVYMYVWALCALLSAGVHQHTAYIFIAPYVAMLRMLERINIIYQEARFDEFA